MPLSMAIQNPPHGNPHVEGNQMVADVIMGFGSGGDTYATGGFSLQPVLKDLAGISWVDRIEVLGVLNGRQMAGLSLNDRFPLLVQWDQGNQKVVLYFPGEYSVGAYAEVPNGHVIGAAGGGFGTFILTLRVYGKRTNI